MASLRWQSHPSAEHCLLTRWGTQTLSTGRREIVAPARLLLTYKFTPELSAAFLKRHKQPLLLWADLSLYSRQITGWEHLISKEYWEEVCLVYTSLEDNSKPLWEMREGQRERWEITSLPLTATVNNSWFLPVFRSWLMPTRTGELCLPGDRHQHRERELWQSGGRITCQESIQSGTCVRLSHEHAGPIRSISTAHPSPTATTRCSLGMEAQAWGEQSTHARGWGPHGKQKIAWSIVLMANPHAINSNYSLLNQD